jgi:hypothetical protein
MTPRRIILASSAVLALLVTGCGRHRPDWGRGWSHRGGRGGTMGMRGGMMGMHGGMMGMRGGMMGARGGMMSMQDPIARLLDHQAVLHLTGAQVNSLIGIDDKLQADNRPIRERMSGWHMTRSGGRRTFWGGQKKPDSAQMAANMAARKVIHDSMTTVMRAIRENNWRAMSAAYAVLNADQINTAAQFESRGGPGMDGQRVLISRFRGGQADGPPGPSGSGGFNRGRGMMRGGGGGSEPPGND